MSGWALGGGGGGVGVKQQGTEKVFKLQNYIFCIFHFFRAIRKMCGMSGKPKGNGGNFETGHFLDLIECKSITNNKINI